MTINFLQVFSKLKFFIVFIFLSAQVNAQYLSELNRTAMIVGGVLPVNEFKTNTSVYEEHKKTTDKAWKDAEKKHYAPIRLWLNNNDIPTTKDTTALFYPFSGPDFLFANIFFTKAKKYLLVGLESPGSEPQLHKLSKDSLSRYFKSVQFSLRYINKAGYFVTSQMIQDLETEHLNGVSHILLFYMSRLGYQVNQLETMQLHPDGKLTTPLTKTNALRIRFIFPGEIQERQLVYVDTDLSDYGLSLQPGLLNFLAKEKKWNVFVKSGSYLLHSKDFSRIRDSILSKYNYILQDDSGIPIKLMPANTYIFGSYTKTTKTFDYAFQSDLAYSMKKNKYYALPFLIGYNVWNNETVLMLASQKGIENLQKTMYIKEKSVPETKVKFETEQIYKIQLLSTSVPQTISILQEKYGTKVEEYKHDGKYKYTCGNFMNQSDAIKFKNELKSKGFNDIFIVKFQNNERID